MAAVCRNFSTALQVFGNSSVIKASTDCIYSSVLSKSHVKLCPSYLCGERYYYSATSQTHQHKVPTTRTYIYKTKSNSSFAQMKKNTNISLCTLKLGTKGYATRILSAQQRSSKKLFSAHIAHKHTGFSSNPRAREKTLELSSTQNLEEENASLNQNEDKDQRGLSDKTLQIQSSCAGWNVRFSIENTYLSWCRNTYLCTVVAIGTLVQLHHVETLLYFKQAAEVLLLIGAINLTWGTGLYTYYLLAARHLMQMGLFTALSHSTYAVLHLVCWLVAISLYLGYVETEGLIDEELLDFGNDTQDV